MKSLQLLLLLLELMPQHILYALLHALGLFLYGILHIALHAGYDGGDCGSVYSLFAVVSCGL